MQTDFNLNRRQFTKAAAGLLLLPSVGVPQVPKVEAPPMRLYSVGDGADPLFDGGWCEAVWARSEKEAIDYATEHYYGYGELDEFCRIQVVGKPFEPYDEFSPKKAGTHFEPRYAVLREIGWRGECDTQCDRCERYSMEVPEWRVCDECFLCPECRAEESRDRCEHCQGGTDGE